MRGSWAPQPQPFLIPDDFRAFMQQVVRYLDAPGEEPKFLDAEDALQDETGYGGRIDERDTYRFTYISSNGHDKWVVQVTEAAIRDIADGLLIEVMGERVDIVRNTDRQPKGQPLLIWGEYADDALIVRDHAELAQAFDSLHALARQAPRMLHVWSAADDQAVAVIWRDDCALYVIESLDGYATSCGDTRRTDAFELVDLGGKPFEAPYQDCVPWPRARAALMRFIERGELGPEIRIEGRIPTNLLMMGEVDRAAALAARVETPRTVESSSLPRMLAMAPGEHAPPHESTVVEVEPIGALDAVEPHDTHNSRVLPADELSAWARRLIEMLNARELIVLGRVSLDEITYQLGGLLQAHGTEAQHSLDTAEWLANEIGAVRGIDKLFATGGDLQIALRRSRTL